MHSLIEALREVEDESKVFFGYGYGISGVL